MEIMAMHNISFQCTVTPFLSLCGTGADSQVSLGNQHPTAGMDSGKYLPGQAGRYLS